TTGFYLSATDTNPSDGVPLVIDMVNPSPLSGGSFVLTAGGATVTWPAGISPGTWTGAVDTSWNTAGNWSDGNVPTTTTDVTIPAGAPRAPTITNLASARNLTVQAGATLNISLSGLNLSGSLDAQGTINGTTTGINLTGTGTIRGNLAGTSFTTLVNGNYSLNGRLVTPGLTINGRLDLAGSGATVGGPGSGNNFQTSNNGVLVMQSPTDSLIMVGGNSGITFGGGSTAGQLTAGVIVMNTTAFTTFTQSSTFSSSSYAPSGTHKVVLNTGATLSLSFATPGTGSHFNTLDISAQAAGFSLATPIQVNGAFVSVPVSTAPAINGGNRLLTAAGGTQVTGLTLTNAPMAITGSAPVVFDNVRFQTMNAAGTQLSVSGQGAAAPVVLNNLVFATTPTTGVYLSAADTDGPTPDALTVDLVNATPATPGAFTQATNGAVIHWPAASPVFSWTGTTSTDWGTGSNWSTGTVPTGTDNVIIPPGMPNAPTINSSVSVNDLTVQAGATLTTNDISVTVNGNLDVAGLLAGCCSDFIGLNGGTLRGNFDDVALTVNAGAVVTLNGATTLTNSDVTIDGELIVNGQTLNVDQSLSTRAGTGLLTMTNPADQVLAPLASFSGGDETGHLTAGVLRAQQLSQGGTVSSSFVAGGNHRAILSGAGFSTLSFADPVNSRFQDLD
ncbi:MAG: hypothetical protein OEV95_15145, partial [Gemmatimonadota bacterium]|nr:hypothetical protein [Gemmatimonadota bacterium]